MRNVLRKELAPAAVLSAAALAFLGGCGASGTTQAKDRGPRIEIEQFGAPTFGDYEHAAEPGPYLPLHAKVLVSCVAQGPKAAAPSAEGLWYFIKAPAKFAGEFAAANTFENGDTSGPLSQQPAVDPRLGRCHFPLEK